MHDMSWKVMSALISVDAHAVWLMNQLAEQLVAAGLQVGRGRADVIADALVDIGSNDMKELKGFAHNLPLCQSIRRLEFAGIKALVH